MLDGINSSLSEIGLSVTLLVIIIIWTIFWKLIALWHSARKGHLVWFVVMALFNTMGIIPILYLFVFKDLKSNKKIRFHLKQRNFLQKRKRLFLKRKSSYHLIANLLNIFFSKTFVLK